MQQDNSEQVIIDPVLIAKHYIRTWFFLDLLSSIPLDYIFLIFSAGNNVCIIGVKVRNMKMDFNTKHLALGRAMNTNDENLWFFFYSAESFSHTI